MINKHGADVSVCNELRFCYREDQSIEILPDQYREVEDEKEYTAQQALETILYQKDFDASACGKLYRTELDVYKRQAVNLGQKGSYGMDVRIAVKVDLSKLNTENLNFFAYDRESNTYVKLTEPKYQILSLIHI